MAYPQHPQDQPEAADGAFPMVYQPLAYPPQRRRVIAIDEDIQDEAQDRSHHGYHHKPGKVGPVYTFVKTDYHGNVKWGVRHVAGKQYGRR